MLGVALDLNEEKFTFNARRIPDDVLSGISAVSAFCGAILPSLAQRKSPEIVCEGGFDELGSMRIRHRHVYCDVMGSGGLKMNGQRIVRDVGQWISVFFFNLENSVNHIVQGNVNEKAIGWKNIRCSKILKFLILDDGMIGLLDITLGCRTNSCFRCFTRNPASDVKSKTSSFIAGMGIFRCLS
ncbi:hypothetical protein CEXT_584411 [Caerostris extrusa]|uniref:Uncharacterized protein n=1 Tax=Caerostris extrusa TaxID=172846 RepID=A0AAV4MPS6_CAEEX|nr:hypothetical protein CEXT_584411 [Caerostris extrusa]